MMKKVVSELGKRIIQIGSKFFVLVVRGLSEYTNLMRFLPLCTGTHTTKCLSDTKHKHNLI